MSRKRRGAEETKAEILKATRKLFAEKGFDRTTIRMIAGEAGCDPALVMRYFGSKRELFIEVVHSPIETLPDALSRSTTDLVAFAETMLEHWHSDATFFGLLRASASDEEAADMMREFFEKRIRPNQQRVTGLPPDQAAMFGAMLVGIAFAREIARIPPMADMTSRQLAEILGSLMSR